MGTLVYGNAGITVAFADRELFHIQIVVTAKLRRHESFLFSWIEVGSGRSTIWLDPSSTILYRYNGNRLPTVNRVWIDALMESANSPGGLFFTPEPGSPFQAQATTTPKGRP